MQTIFILGPTAVGKSAVALELARKLEAELVSADSMQVYRGMDIGTAKVKSEERLPADLSAVAPACAKPASAGEGRSAKEEGPAKAGRAIRHHLIDVCELSEPFDAKRFVELASAALDDIRARGKRALVVGGTGLYVRALRRGLFEGPSRNAKLRAELERKSAAELFAELHRVDPRTAARIDRHNPRRLVRALEVYYATGKPITELQTQWKTPHLDPLPQTTGERRFPLPRLRGEGPGEGFYFCLSRERDDLHARIERRIDGQIAAGWVDEVRALMARGLERNAMAMQAAGYRELVSHLRGKLSLAEAVKLIKTRTRQLARRQLTWFRHEPDVTWVEIPRDETAAETARRVLAMLPKEMAKV